MALPARSRAMPLMTEDTAADAAVERNRAGMPAVAPERHDAPQERLPATALRDQQAHVHRLGGLDDDPQPVCARHGRAEAERHGGPDGVQHERREPVHALVARAILDGEDDRVRARRRPRVARPACPSRLRATLRRRSCRRTPSARSPDRCRTPSSARVERVVGRSALVRLHGSPGSSRGCGAGSRRARRSARSASAARPRGTAA